MSIPDPVSTPVTDVTWYSFKEESIQRLTEKSYAL